MSGTIHGAFHKSARFFRAHPAAAIVYLIYLSRLNRENVAWPSLRGLAKETAWSVNECRQARDFLVGHGALELVKDYVRPEWRKLPDKEKQRKTSLDKAEYYRPTGVLIVDGKTYHLLYIPASEASPALDDVSPDDTSHDVSRRAMSHTDDDRPGDTELDSITKLDSITAEGDSTEDSFAPDGTKGMESKNPLAPDFEESGAESAVNPSTPSAAPPPSPNGRSKKPARDNARLSALKNAIADAFDWDWKTMTKSEAGKIQAAATQLYDAGVAVELVPRLFAQCKTDFSQFGPNALCSVVSKVRAGAAQAHARIDAAAQTEAPEDAREISPEERATLIAWAREQLRGGDGQRA